MFSKQLGMLRFLDTWITLEAFYGFIMYFYVWKIDHHSPQMFGRWLQSLFPVKFSAAFCGLKNRIFIFEWTIPLGTAEQVRWWPQSRIHFLGNVKCVLIICVTVHSADVEIFFGKTENFYPLKLEDKLRDHLNQKGSSSGEHECPFNSWMDCQLTDCWQPIINIPRAVLLAWLRTFIDSSFSEVIICCFSLEFEPLVRHKLDYGKLICMHWPH